MLCPVCKVDMFVLEFEQVEIDFCYTCGGVWLDSGELEMIGERAGAVRQDLLRALETREGRAPKEGTRRCPVCRRRLLEVRTESDPPVVVDRCSREHGLWFDHGELAAVVAAAGAERDNVLARFLGSLAARQPTQEPAGETGDARRENHLGADPGQSA